MLELKQLLVETKQAWVEYPGLRGFEVEVAMLSRPALTKLRKGCITSKMNRRTREVEEDLDEDKFVAKFTEATVKNWKGLTVEHLQTLVLINTEGQDLTAELEFSQDQAEMLVTNSTEFDTWLNEVVFDLDNFRSGTKRGEPEEA